MARSHSIKTTKNNTNVNQPMQVQCPYCQKEYKKPGFWLTNHLMLKHRKGFDIRIFFIDAVIITFIIGGAVNALFYYGIIDKITGLESPPVRIEGNQFKLILTQKLSEWNVSECSDVVEGLGNKFPQLNCAKPNESEYSNKPELCASNVTVKDGAMLIDNCDIAYQKFHISSDGYAIGINFKPLWKIDEYSVHYLLDIISGNDSERNRISLYTQNGYLKYSISNKYGTKENLIKIDLRNNSGWKEQDFNQIQIKWYGDFMIIDLNGNVRVKVVENNDLNLSDSFLFLGSNVFGVEQATGYFDEDIFGYKYVYPEATIVYVGTVENR